MTKEQFKDIQAQLGAKNKELSIMMGTSIRNVEDWRSGNSRVLPATERLIRILAWLKAHEPITLSAILEGVAG